MANSNQKEPEDRQQAALDFRKRVLAWQDQNQVLPSVDIYDEPVRYYKLNKEWAKIIWGLLNHLEQPAAWPLAEDQDYSGIQQVMKFEQGIDMPLEVDCEHLEDCLETSTIIIDMQTVINNQTEIINNLTQEIERLEDEQATDGVDIPPNPTMVDSGNDLCKSANYIAMRVAADLLVIWADASTLTLQEFMNAMLGITWWNFDKAKAFWQYAATVANPDLATDAQAYIDDIKTALFCSELNKEETISAIFDAGTIPDNEEALWTATIDKYTQGQLDEWAVIGALDTATPDCTDGCPWKIVYDFDGTYTPNGSEDEILTGDTWGKVNAIFTGGIGYIRSGGTMEIFLDLPEQCKLERYNIRLSNSENCSATDFDFYQRGASGTGAEAYGVDIVVVNDNPTNQTFPVEPTDVGAIMTQARVRAIPTGCTGTPDAKIHRVELIGTGARPSL